MNIKPLHDKVLIERLENIKETASGIILRHSEEPDRAKVLAIGPQVTEVQVGDVVQPDWSKVHLFVVLLKLLEAIHVPLHARIIQNEW